MPREFTAAEREDLTPGEIAALMGENPEAAAAAALAEKTAETVAAERAEETGKTDDKPALTPEEVVAAAEAEAQAKAATEATPGEAETDTDSEGGEADVTAEALQRVLEEDAPAPAAPKPVTYTGISQANYDKSIGEIDAKKAEGLAQLMDGTITAADYAKIDSEQSKARDKLISSFTLAEANREAAEAQTKTLVADLQTNVNRIADESKGAKVDYTTDAKARVQYDQALQLITSDKDNFKLTPRQVAEEAHKTVLALRGIVVGAPAPAPAPAPKPAPGKRDVPVTLAGLPAAAPNNAADDLRSQFSRLSGDDAEEFLERLPAGQRKALLAGAHV